MTVRVTTSQPIRAQDRRLPARMEVGVASARAGKPRSGNHNELAELQAAREIARSAN